MMNAMLIAVLSLALVQGQSERTINGSTPAAGLTSIEVRGNVGSFTMTAAPVSEIRVSVRLTAKTSWRLFGRETGNPD